MLEATKDETTRTAVFIKHKHDLITTFREKETRDLYLDFVLGLNSQDYH